MLGGYGYLCGHDFGAWGIKYHEICLGLEVVADGNLAGDYVGQCVDEQGGGGEPIVTVLYSGLEGGVVGQ